MNSLESEAEQIKGYFSLDTLQKWAQAVESCDGNHDDFHLLEKVRMITMNDGYRKLQNNRADYLIPDASMVVIPGVSGDVSRGFVSPDVILRAEIMAYSRVIKHGLSEDDLELIYKHHCVEPLVFIGKKYGLTQQESLTTLSYYIGRITSWIH